jgi:hypothetical protein
MPVQAYDPNGNLIPGVPNIPNVLFAYNNNVLSGPTSGFTLVTGWNNPPFISGTWSYNSSNSSFKWNGDDNSIIKLTLKICGYNTSSLGPPAWVTFFRLNGGSDFPAFPSSLAGLAQNTIATNVGVVSTGVYVMTMNQGDFIQITYALTNYHTEDMWLTLEQM